MADLPPAIAPATPTGTLLQAGQSYPFDATVRAYFGEIEDGLLVVYLNKAVTLKPVAAAPGAPAPRRLPPPALGPWLHLDAAGGITLYVGKVEVGQNIRTSLGQLVADALQVPPASVTLVMGDTDRTPFDIGTFSSLTTRITGMQVRHVAAAARRVLLESAADVWAVEPGALHLHDGRVHHPATGQSAAIGALVEGLALLLPVDRQEPVMPPAQWTVAGASAPKAGGRAFVTGRHTYTSDLHLPGMVYGKILRPDALDATLVSADTRPAEAMAGVTVVHEGDFIGVTAPDTWTAAQAIDAIDATWTTPAQPSDQDVFAYFRAHPLHIEGRDGVFTHTAGSVDEALARADHTLAQTYTADYIAHAPLEPRAAVARWEAGKLTVWTGTQRPFAVRRELAEALDVAEHRVRVIVPDTGSAYGGKHTGEAALEAARLARAVGRPVKVLWTRQEEFTWAYFRAAGVIDVTSGVQPDGTLAAWRFETYNAGSHAIETPYAVPHQHIHYQPTRSPLRQGPYRGLAATANLFARETHIDELAHRLGMDPLAFRYKNLTDARLRAVLEAAAQAFGWGEAAPRRHHGFGIAVGCEKGGYVATAAEVYVDPADGAVQVVRVAEAYECGAVLNPDQLTNQIEGALIQGLGGALFERIAFADGRIHNAALAHYRVPRFSDVPRLDVVLLDRNDLPSGGGGETPMVCIAPALGNAIFDATGIRLRALPLAPRGVRPTPPA